MLPLPPLDDTPSWFLYGEDQLFPDILHVERLHERAAGLGWRIGDHRHPSLHQFILVRTGRAEIRGNGRTFVPAPPFVLSVPQGATHGFAFSAGTDGYVVTLTASTMLELIGAQLAPAGELDEAHAVPADAALLTVFERIHAEHRDRAPGRTLMLSALVMELACLFQRQSPAQQAEPAQDPRLQKFLDLLGRASGNRWSVEDYADKVGISSRHLSRLCKSATGLPAGQLIEAVAVREACRRLAFARAPIAIIAADLGYDDPSYFSRAFRRHTGCSPSDYRKRISSPGVS